MTSASVETLRIFIIESQALFGKALCQVFSLDPELQVVGSAERIDAALLAKARPSVILVDLDVRDVELEQAIATCREAAPGAKICILSMRSQPETMQRCIAAGAEGYVVKDVMPAELIRAAKMVAGGMSYVDPRVAGDLLRRRNNLNGRPDLDELSGREIAVVRLVTEGLSNKEISARLNLSEKTVKNHISRIFSKLNVTARTQAAVYALKNGLV